MREHNEISGRNREQLCGIVKIIGYEIVKKQNA